MLTKIYVFLLICIPSVWVVAPLGSVGPPAGILAGSLLLAAWVVPRVTRWHVALGTTAVHSLLLLFAAGFAAAGARRPDGRSCLRSTPRSCAV